MSENLIDVVIRTEIEKGSDQAGMKSTQTITIETDTGKMRSVEVGLGETDFGIYQQGPWSWQNDFPEPKTELKDDGTIKINVNGTTASPAIIFPSIDYEFEISIHPKTGVATVSGKHDAYPSYSIIIGKDKDVIYKFEHKEVKLSELWQKLHGDADDVKIDGHKSSFQKVEAKKSSTKPSSPTRGTSGGDEGGGDRGGRHFGIGDGLGSRLGDGGGGCRSTRWEGNTVVCVKT